jgi:hypothetical protein
MITLVEGEQPPNLVVEDRNDPHRTLMLLYIITLVVAVAAAYLFKTS